MTKFTISKIKPILLEIATEEEFLDFRRDSDLTLDERKDNYYKCIDYTLDIIACITEATFVNMERNPFTVFLCKYSFN